MHIDDARCESNNNISIKGYRNMTAIIMLEPVLAHSYSIQNRLLFSDYCRD